MLLLHPELTKSQVKPSQDADSIFCLKNGEAPSGEWSNAAIRRAKTNMYTPKFAPFRPPLRSRATRKISRRSKVSGRGVIVAQLPAQQRPREIVFESILELYVFYLLLARPELHDLWEQPTPIQYLDDLGCLQTHYYDALVTLKDMSTIAIAIKPAALVEEFRFRDKLHLIRAGTSLNFANEVVLITDRSFSPADVRNAQKLHEFRRHPDLEADAAILALLETLGDETTVADLVAKSGLEWRGFRAVFRAIYDGQARVLDEGDIDTSTRLVSEVAQ